MIQELAKKAKAINVRELALLILRDNGELVNSRIREQLTVGESGTGRDVGKYKSDRYAIFKQRIGSQAPSGVVDLKLSGSLYDGLFTKIKGFSIETDSKVNYSKYQKVRYGDEIYELQKENQKDIEFQLSQAIIEAYFSKLGLQT